MATNINAKISSIVCGSRAGYQKHKSMREEYCNACKKAESQYKSEWYKKNKITILAKHKEWDLKNTEKRRELRRKTERKRRSDKFNNGSEPYSEQQVLNEYEAICHICTNSIDLSLSRKSPMGLQIDHLVPLAKGGQDKLNNVRPSHARCNQQKGVKVLTSTLK